LNQKEESKISSFSEIIKDKRIPSTFTKILKQYSQLCCLIEEMNNIKDEQTFSNYMFKFSKMSGIKFLIKGYKEFLEKDYESEYNIEYKIKEFYHLAASTLITNLVQDSMDNKYDINIFIDYLSKLMKVENNCIEELGSCFNDDDYIYLPKLSIKDVYYCFKYGIQDKYSGDLVGIYNRSISIDPWKEGSNDDYFLYLIKKYSKNKIEELIIIRG
jgi:hypothetical protein